MNPLVFAIKRSFLGVRRNLDERLGAFGVSTPQLEVLLILCDSGEVEQRTLVDDVASRSASLTTLLSRMEQQELILRRPDPHDGRRVLVSVAEGGQRLVDLLATEVEPAFVTDFEDGITAADLVTTRRVLDQIAANMAAQPERRNHR